MFTKEKQAVRALAKLLRQRVLCCLWWLAAAVTWACTSADQASLAGSETGTEEVVSSLRSTVFTVVFPGHQDSELEFLYKQSIEYAKRAADDCEEFESAGEVAQKNHDDVRAPAPDVFASITPNLVEKNLALVVGATPAIHRLICHDWLGVLTDAAAETSLRHSLDISTGETARATIANHYHSRRVVARALLAMRAYPERFRALVGSNAQLAVYAIGMTYAKEDLPGSSSSLAGVPWLHVSHLAARPQGWSARSPCDHAPGKKGAGADLLAVLAREADQSNYQGLSLFANHGVRCNFYQKQLDRACVPLGAYAWNNDESFGNLLRLDPTGCRALVSAWQQSS